MHPGGPDRTNGTESHETAILDVARPLLVAVVGVIFGVAGIFLAPILGILAIIAIGIWLAERKAQHKPPLE